MKKFILLFLFILSNLKSNSQCRDTILEKFGTGLPTQGGTWSANSIIYGNSTLCPGLSCSYSPEYYLNLNGFGDFIRTPLIPNPSVFSFWYKRSGTTPNFHRAVVETSSDGITWTTQLTITTFTTTYTKVTLSVNNVYVRIRDIRTSALDTKVWYIDDVAWSWEARIGVWTGGISSDWSNPLNWCKGQVPTSTDDVVIPPGTTYGCIVNPNVIAECKNISVTYPGSLTVNGRIKINGVINSTQTIYLRNGALELNGLTTQNLRGSMFNQYLVGNLDINNDVGVTLQGFMDSLKIKNSLTFSKPNSNLNTNGNLVLLSSDSVTARIGELNNNQIIGDVTVERFIPLHSKAWQLLAVPTRGKTINANWQEGNPPLGDSKPRRGILLTGPFLGSDLPSTLPSIKFYNSTTNLWDGIGNTSNLINTNQGYMVFVRGDRSVTAFNQPPTETTLRTTGNLFTPSSPPPTISVGANKFECVNNFYASAIDFAKLTRTGGVQNTFWVWDPKLTTSSVSSYGLGGYQNFVWNGTNYVVVPGGGSYTNGNVNIESGNAFFVKSLGTSGTLTFNESAKTNSNFLTTRVRGLDYIKTNILVSFNQEQILLDGTVCFFGRFSNNLDSNDVNKFDRAEGISIIRNSINLSAEFRDTNLRQDTLFLNLISLRPRTYHLDIKLELQNSSAILVDKLLNVSTVINDSLNYIFTVSPNSSQNISDRFMIILRKKIRVKNTIQPTESFDFVVSPNPIQFGDLKFTIDGPWGLYKGQISNLAGNTVYTLNFFHTKGKTLYTFPTRLKEGYYNLHLKNKSTFVSKLFLVFPQISN